MAPSAGDAGHGGNNGLPHQPLGSIIGSRFKSSPQRRRKIATVRRLGLSCGTLLLPRVLVGAVCVWFSVEDRCFKNTLRTG